MSLTNKIPEIIAEIEAAVRAAELAGAEKVAEAARERVAYDDREPHHLRDAIHTEETEDGVLVVAGDRDVFWGNWVEHGTVKMGPQPFLVPSLEENREAIIAETRLAIRKATG